MGGFKDNFALWQPFLTHNFPRTWWYYQLRLAKVRNFKFEKLVSSLQFFRDNGIVIGVTCWQWVMELALTILVTIFHFMRGKNRVIEHGMFLFASGFSYVFLPAFYLMADQQFRNDFDKKGLFKAIINSFTGGPWLTNILSSRENPKKWYFVTKSFLTYCEKKCSIDQEKLLKFESEGW